MVNDAFPRCLNSGLPACLAEGLRGVISQYATETRVGVGFIIAQAPNCLKSHGIATMDAFGELLFAHDCHFMNQVMS